MTEGLNNSSRDNGRFSREVYEDLFARALKNIEDLSLEHRKRLAQFGYYFLDVEKNHYLAKKVFAVLQDFEGLRKVADSLLRTHLDSVDLPDTLTLLEDHEGIRNLLNRQDWDPRGGYSYELAFESIHEPFRKHINQFLEQNKTPIATGDINEGVDLIAIHNLAKDYDIAVPIARGGLYQGAIANLWGMPTRIIDIAAHKRKVARGKWVNPVSGEDFKGKRVLFFDKDAVSGASVRKAVSMVDKFSPSSTDIYFTHPVKPPGSVAIGTLTTGLPEGMKVYSPKNAPIQNRGDVYMEAHERLETLYGRRRVIERLLLEEADQVQETFPGLADAFRKFIAKHLEVFDILNPYLAGISSVRETILAKMNHLLLEHKGHIKDNLYSMPGLVERFVVAIKNTKPLFLGFESQLVEARYKKEGQELAQKRNVENPHLPRNPLASFNAAQRAMKEGYDMVLIVGPEGFAYEPYFRDLGATTIAVNIPESEAGGLRTINLLDDLSSLQGKKVLVVEDDVRTGATLQKLLENLKPHSPRALGLYLGQSSHFQETTNIPSEFSKIYIAEDGLEASNEFTEHLKSKGLKIFKTPNI